VGRVAIAGMGVLDCVSYPPHAHSGPCPLPSPPRCPPPAAKLKAKSSSSELGFTIKTTLYPSGTDSSGADAQSTPTGHVGKPPRPKHAFWTTERGAGPERVAADRTKAQEVKVDVNLLGCKVMEVLHHRRRSNAAVPDAASVSSPSPSPIIVKPC
jgi:hypothetical protein